MSIENFRAGVTQAIVDWHQANYPTLDIAFENGPVPDQNAVSSPWIDVELRMYSGSSLGVGGPKSGRYTGTVAVRCFTKAGEGTRQVDAILDSLDKTLSGLRVAGGAVEFPDPMMPVTALGWYKRGLMFPFRVDV